MGEVSLWVCVEEVCHAALTPLGEMNWSFKQARGHLRECGDNQECENREMDGSFFFQLI